MPVSQWFALPVANFQLVSGYWVVVCTFLRLLRKCKRFPVSLQLLSLPECL